MRFFLKRHLTYDKYYGLFNWEFYETNRSYTVGTETSEGFIVIKNYNKVKWDRCVKSYFEVEKHISKSKLKKQLEILIGGTMFMQALYLKEPEKEALLKELEDYKLKFENLIGLVD
tara:strand:- start:734 stop:1081 length:348 start_codon:yes stop_codon:yes gene_type:complete